MCYYREDGIVMLQKWNMQSSHPPQKVVDGEQGRSNDDSLHKSQKGSATHASGASNVSLNF